jgi:hypothetical protein
MWNIGTKARGFALGLVVLAFSFSALWVGIGTGIHKRYETPTPVRRSSPFPFAPCPRH